MKTQILTIIILALLSVNCNNTSKVEDLKNENEKVSYAIGVSLEGGLKSLENTLPVEENINVDDYIKGLQAVANSSKGKSASYFQGFTTGGQILNYLRNNKTVDKVNYDLIYQGIKDKFKGDSLLITEDSMQSIIQKYFEPYDKEAQNTQRENQQKRLDKKKEDNKKASEAFLNENKSKEGVKTTASGLQYKVIKEGTGETHPTDTDKVQVIYRGTTVDGKEFDSSKGTATSFNVTQVIKGWTEGLKLMKKGSKYKFYIPANIAYAEQNKPNIGPNQALIFDVELVDFAPIPAEEIKQLEEQKKQQEQMMKQMQQQQMPQQAHGN